MAIELQGLSFELDALLSSVEPIQIINWVEFPQGAYHANRLRTAMMEIAESVLVLLPASFCQILMRDNDGNFFGKVVFFGPEPQGLHLQSDHLTALYQKVFTQHTPLVITADQTSLGLTEGRALKFYQSQALILAPMRVNNNPIGIMVLGDLVQNNREPFHDGKVRQGGLLAGQAAFILQNLLFPDEPVAQLDIINHLANYAMGDNPESAGHGRTLVPLCQKLAVAMGCDRQIVQAIGLAALFHDIGKIAIPISVLRKPETLNEAEWVSMKRHPVIGAQLVTFAARLYSVAHLIRYHHERFDGGGYPQGLSGSWIPLGSRILSVVDSFDSMVTGRPYNYPHSVVEAIKELKVCSGTQFDPLVVDHFIDIL
ncbi:MAG TPA: HD domain-containing phosphohydrolase [Longilinea sp.]|nr:HD domain-containing phosphohydrolase [Longilinea sp.]